MLGKGCKGRDRGISIDDVDDVRSVPSLKEQSLRRCGDDAEVPEEKEYEIVCYLDSPSAYVYKYLILV